MILSQVVRICNVIESSRAVEISVFYYRAGYGPDHYVDGEGRVRNGVVLISSIQSRVGKSEDVWKGVGLYSARLFHNS